MASGKGGGMQFLDAVKDKGAGNTPFFAAEPWVLSLVNGRCLLPRFGLNSQSASSKNGVI